MFLMKMHEEVKFLDILEPRRTQTGIFRFMTRAWYPKRSQIVDKIYSPQDLKDITAASLYLETVIEAESLKNGTKKETLKKEVLKYIDEIGMDKKLHRIRWLGIFALKIAFNMNIGIYVNEQAILKVKNGMGKNPLLFLPTHRSYADFCILTYLCYHYDIDFPAVASGMDFYSMAVIGQVLRDTCAFYIRRTLVGAPVYAATLKQYVRTLVAKHCAPIEFFLEGTRSRSNKSLCPKYGMLSMALMPFFAREVPDITIVPVNISYDRLMEQSTFAYEHLGVPKPKESTRGLLKWLSSLNDDFGNMYINMGEPISVRNYMHHIPHSEESLKPLDLQEISPEQFRQVQVVAEFTVTQQQRSTVATISNLLAIVLMQSLMQQRCLTYDEVLEDVEWVEKVIRNLGGTVFEENARENVDKILSIHSKWWTLDSERRLRIIFSDTIHVTENLTNKMKGHLLKADTMMNAIPIVQLQMYVNPILHYIVPPALIYVLVHRRPMTLDTLRKNYQQLRKLLRYEFFHIEKHEEETFKGALEFCVSSGVVGVAGGEVAAADGARLQTLLRWAVWPALATLLDCADVALQQKNIEHKTALKMVQECAERTFQHPYCLSLDAAGNCLQGYVSVGALKRDKQDQNTHYVLVGNVMEEYRELVSSILPEFKVDFSSRNPVVLDRRAKSRL